MRREEGTTINHIQVSFSDKRKKTLIYVSSAFTILLMICVLGYFVIQPRVPSFRLENLYASPISSNSSVIVQLLSTNPSPQSSIYYTNVNLHLKVLGNLETESVSLENKLQEPHGVAIWTAVVATNSDKEMPSGTFMVRKGIADGHVIANIMIQWKIGFFSTSKFGYQVRCPVLVRLEDLSSAIPKPMSTCSHHST